MDRKLARSSRGVLASSAIERTRALKSSPESSRLKKRALCGGCLAGVAGFAAERDVARCFDFAGRIRAVRYSALDPLISLMRLSRSKTLPALSIRSLDYLATRSGGYDDVTALVAHYRIAAETDTGEPGHQP